MYKSEIYNNVFPFMISGHGCLGFPTVRNSIFHELTTIHDLHDIISKHCVTYAKFTTAKKHIQVLPYKGILSPSTVAHLILSCCTFYS